MTNFKSIIEFSDYFSDNQRCLDYLEKLRWSNTIKCPHCQSNKKIYKLKHNFKCSECQKQFSHLKGTIFENSPIPLRKWFLAIYYILNSKKGISSVQLSKFISITQKSAWYVLQKIRTVIKNGMFDFAKRFSGIVEVDETYIRRRNTPKRSYFKKQGRSNIDKIPVFGMVERGSRKVYAVAVNSVNRQTLQSLISEFVVKGTTIISDDWRAYTGLNNVYEHHTVNHSKREWVRGDKHTNTIEGFWSMLKRGLLGTYHSVSPKHIDKYLSEFCFRYETCEMKDYERFESFFSFDLKKNSFDDVKSKGVFRPKLKLVRKERT